MMKLNWIDRLGDRNPQLLREIKGKFKPRDLLTAAAISLLGQFFLFRYFHNQLPIAKPGMMVAPNRYCLDGNAIAIGLPQCLVDASGNLAINWQLWWQDLFSALSLIGVFALIVAGTYMLISDLAQEEQRGTLNFIRLSPQSPRSILVGKLLGVPILLYAIAGLALPLHLWAGLSAQISLGLILSFYGLLFASCLFFYSVALLFGLVSNWLGGFQAWLGSSVVLTFLWNATFQAIAHTPADWLNLFSPSLVLPISPRQTLRNFLFDSEIVFQSPAAEVTNLEWFFLQLGGSTIVAVSFALLNYSLWTYWIWQALQRRFPNPGKTILDKSQSYLVVVCFEVAIIGFAATSPKWPDLENAIQLSLNFQDLLLSNLLLFLGAIAVLTPQRQALQDWARYRWERVSSRKDFWNWALVKDLIWGEKSPAIVAIALNMAIAIAMLTPWILFVIDPTDKLTAFLSLIIGASLILVYAAIAQLLIFMRTQKQAFWVTGAVSAAVTLPPAVLSLLTLPPEKAPGLWLLTPFAWTSIEHASTSTIFLALLGEWSIFTLCTLQITRQLQKAGDASKALFSSRPVLKG